MGSTELCDPAGETVPCRDSFGPRRRIGRKLPTCQASVILCAKRGKSIEFLRERLSETHKEHLSAFWPENCHVRTGQPFQEICHLAREINAGLIVIGTRGQTGLQRILLGSTAERVVRFASRPVLVVRRRKEPKEFTLRNILHRSISLSAVYPVRCTLRFLQKRSMQDFCCYTCSPA